LPELLAANQRAPFTADAGELKKCGLVVVSLDVPTDAANRSDLTGLQQLIAASFRHSAPRPHSSSSAGHAGFTRSIKSVPDETLYQVETLIFGRAVERALHQSAIHHWLRWTRQSPCRQPTRMAASVCCPLLPMRYESVRVGQISINLFLVSSVATTNTLAELV